jgi:hypothetical protein
MMNDLNQIRSYIEWILSNYRDGYFDLANAAVSTNTGINLARNLIDQVLPIIKDHGSACTILEKFSFVCARRDGLPEDDIVAWGPAVENEDIMRLQTKPTQCQSIAWWFGSGFTSKPFADLQRRHVWNVASPE